MIALAEKYQVMPPPTDEEYEALKADIAERGVQVPVEYDEDGNILDGSHRVRACQELGITDWPKVVRRGLTEEQKFEHALALNLHRRHLTREQRRELVVRLRQQGWSLRRIAERLGVHHDTVREDLLGVGNPTPATVTGADGKQYPATKPIPVIEAPKTSKAEAPAEASVFAAQSQEPALEAPVVVAAASAPQPHVAYNSGNNEWYTPPEYIEAARVVMGGIDLDPASSPLANEVVKATLYFAAEDDGLKHPWAGRVWMNPPYSQPLIQQFCEKLVGEFTAGRTLEAIVLVNNATETGWFNTLVEAASAVVFPKGRVKFWGPDGQGGAPLQGQAVLYFGRHPAKFMTEFHGFGWGAYL